MRFMMLVKATEDSEAGVMPSAEMLVDMGRFNEEMIKAGVLLAADGLDSSSNGVRVRYAGSKRTVIDGPFTEAKELVAGYRVIQVKSKDEAIQWANRVPFQDGEVEIRKVFEASLRSTHTQPLEEIPMKIEPYLFFQGRCEEAIDLYKRVLGAEVVMLLRCKDGPEPEKLSPGLEDKIMHACIRIGETQVMASDGMNTGKATFQGVTLSITVADPAEAERVFGALAEGGHVHQPLTQTFFSPSFGMLADRFGVSWMVVV